MSINDSIWARGVPGSVKMLDPLKGTWKNIQASPPEGEGLEEGKTAEKKEGKC